MVGRAVRKKFGGRYYAGGAPAEAATALLYAASPAALAGWLQGAWRRTMPSTPGSWFATRIRTSEGRLPAPALLRRCADQVQFAELHAPCLPASPPPAGRSWIWRSCAACWWPPSSSSRRRCRLSSSSSSSSRGLRPNRRQLRSWRLMAGASTSGGSQAAGSAAASPRLLARRSRRAAACWDFQASWGACSVHALQVRSARPNIPLTSCWLPPLQASCLSCSPGRQPAAAAR